jgi:uncharacterized protein YdeI (YjbR/CyaY-like superfamily)
MKSKSLQSGTVHTLPKDLAETLSTHSQSVVAWNDITALARNECICWVENAKQLTTRKRRITRTAEDLTKGKRRPCCWVGCSHRVKNGK